MNIELIYVLIAIAVGLGATIVMDLCAIFLKRAFNIPSPNYCFVGRWLRYMPEGIFRHSSIAAAPQKPAECTVGWIAHYAIGDRKSTRLNSSHRTISYAVFCLKKKK